MCCNLFGLNHSACARNAAGKFPARGAKYGKAVDAFLDLLEDDRKVEFVDDFLTLPFDCSNAWLIYTANTLEGIPEPILDRLRIVEMKRYTLKEMERISERIIDKMNREISPRKLEFDEDAIKTMVLKRGIMNYSVRPLRDAIEQIFSSKASTFITNARLKTQKVTSSDIEGCLSLPNLEIPGSDGAIAKPGMVNAIAVNLLSGYLAPLEVTQSESEYLSVYGSCDDVMKENAYMAFDLVSSFIKEKEERKIPPVNINYITSIPKSGDSAGLATALAILSECKKIPIDPKIAVTGAITLKGAVLPVGLIIAKVYGAMMQKAECIIIPEENRKELEAVLPQIEGKVEIRYVSSFEEAVKIVFPGIKYKKPVQR